MTMARSCGRTYVITFVAASLFFIAPLFLQRYPQTAALAVVFTWVIDRYLQGLAVLILLAVVFALGSLISDARLWLTGARKPTPSPTPADLEDGTATPLRDLEALEAEVAGAGAEAPAPELSEISTTRKLIALFTGTIIISYQIYDSGVVSLEKPALDNVAAVLVYLLRGLEILFVGLLLLICAACCTKNRRRSGFATTGVATTPASPTAVLFDDGTAAAEDLPVAMEEKNQKEGERAVT
ncbi:hypothetical protein FB451DRAFT_1247688 [Mycena latifolia]|nr:hypothetical protein FB451DRAFT_1247688 [Mycena latifolia]